MATPIVPGVGYYSPTVRSVLDVASAQAVPTVTQAIDSLSLRQIQGYAQYFGAKVIKGNEAKNKGLDGYYLLTWGHGDHEQTFHEASLSGVVEVLRAYFGGHDRFIDAEADLAFWVSPVVNAGGAL